MKIDDVILPGGYVFQTYLYQPHHTIPKFDKRAIDKAKCRADWKYCTNNKK